MSGGVEVFYRDNVSGKPVPVSQDKPLPVTGGSGGGSSDMTETNARLGATNEAAAATDTAVSGLNGLLKRLAQSFTSLLTLQQRITGVARLASALGTAGDAANAKASAGTLYAAQGYNAASAVRYLKIYNTAGVPTAGAGTPILSLALPPNAGFAFDWPRGIAFATGIGFTLVTGPADNSATGVTAGDIVGLNIEYS